MEQTQQPMMVGGILHPPAPRTAEPTTFEASAVFLLFAFVAAMIVFGISRSRLAHNGEWHSHGDQMRRYVNGKWEYRERTQDEAQGDAESRVW